MSNLIDIHSYPVQVVLHNLLEDKSTQQNIIFATDDYLNKDPSITAKTPITVEILKSLQPCLIQPRTAKSFELQAERTHKMAEVFTPAWVCNKMNNQCDSDWFGRESIFNVETEQDWLPISEPVLFTDGKTWQDYVDSRRMEIACGEAPYLVSRYDVSNGQPIELNKRIGMLDRKLRIIKENTQTEADWLKWTYRAYQSIYGYEFQGDNLLIARINLLLTFVDYMQDKWNRVPTTAELRKMTNIICWNLWQMDGLTDSVPFRKPVEENSQMDFFDLMGEESSSKVELEAVDCKIFDWRSNEPISYKKIKERKRYEV